MEGKILAAVRENKIIVALRKVPSDKMKQTAEALYRGGIRMLEVTFDQADPQGAEKTAGAIRAVREAMGDRMMVGAGTVMSVEQLHAAADAGAQYMLSPNLNMDVLKEAVKLGIPAIPGAMTPSEIAAAWDNGAELVKVFPAGCFGISYVKAISAPMNHIPMLGMGGISEKNIADYLALPAMAGVGIGSNIARLDLIESGDFEGLTRLAERYVELAKG